MGNWRRTEVNEITGGYQVFDPIKGFDTLYCCELLCPCLIFGIYTDELHFYPMYSLTCLTMKSCGETGTDNSRTYSFFFFTLCYHWRLLSINCSLITVIGMSFGCDIQE